MVKDDTNELEIAVTETPKQRSDSKRTAYFFAFVIGLCIFLAIGLLIAAFDQKPKAGEIKLDEATELTNNEDRIAAANINLEDVVEEPSKDQLELMLETDFFSEVGFDDEIVERLNKQAEEAIADFKDELPQIPETDLDIDIDVDFVAERDRIKELLDSADPRDLSDVSDLADQISGLLE